MSLYQILNVDRLCGVEEIHKAAALCRSRLESECSSSMLPAAINYINTIEYLLSHPEARECYDNIDSAKDNYITPLRASLILKRVQCYNAVSNVSFGDSFLCELRKQSKSSFSNAPLVGDTSKKLKCHWCDKCIDKTDVMTALCKCSSRSGHASCVNRFVSEHGRCPVCRTKLLMRSEVSKYMLFCRDKKYEVR